VECTVGSPQLAVGSLARGKREKDKKLATVYRRQLADVLPLEKGLSDCPAEVLGEIYYNLRGKKKKAVS